LKWRNLIPILRLLGKKGVRLTPDDISIARDVMSTIYNSFELGDVKKPKLLTIEIPAAGVGTELSAHFSLKGKFEILN
jgi:hypothetical protein